MSCPMCNGETAELGSLGGREWRRCFDCGWEFVSTDEDERNGRHIDGYDADDLGESPDF